MHVIAVLFFGFIKAPSSYMLGSFRCHELRNAFWIRARGIKHAPGPQNYGRCNAVTSTVVGVYRETNAKECIYYCAPD